MRDGVWAPNGYLAQAILEHFPPGYQGWGIDVGASDGVSINTTFHLEKIHRWTILSVEPNPDFAPALKKNRAFVETCACGDAPSESDFHIHIQNPEAISSLRPTKRKDIVNEHDLGYPPSEMKWKKVRVRVERVDDLLKKWQFPKLDVLCADTEGTELDVLRGANLIHWKPKVIVTECWDKVGPIDIYLEALGYKKTARNVHNDIFVRSSDV